MVGLCSGDTDRPFHVVLRGCWNLIKREAANLKSDPTQRSSVVRLAMYDGELSVWSESNNAVIQDARCKMQMRSVVTVHLPCKCVVRGYRNAEYHCTVEATVANESIPLLGRKCISGRRKLRRCAQALLLKNQCPQTRQGMYKVH